jgi:peptide/nickel transport system ATP-binding protein
VSSAPAVVQLSDVEVEFHRRGHPVVRAVAGASISVGRGQIVGLVGESGCGKSTLARAAVGLVAPTAGSVVFEGNTITPLTRRARPKDQVRLQMVFQNPFSSLNPRRSVRDTLSSGLAIHLIARGREREERLVALLRRVGLHEAMLDRHPHEFSGGQRQRIVIARALSVGPEVLIADEPVSALDVSIQAQVLNLLGELRRDMQLSVVFITHDLRVANFFCDRIGVLYLGRLVEVGPRAAVVGRSYHPYTRMLLSAAPSGDPAVRPSRPLVRGEIGVSDAPRHACVFSPRCWLREKLGRPDACTTEVPPLRPLADGHLAACHFAEEVA